MIFTLRHKNHIVNGVIFNLL